MTDYSKLYIDGSWVPSTGSDTIDVENPSTEEVIASDPGRHRRRRRQGGGGGQGGLRDLEPDHQGRAGQVHPGHRRGPRGPQRGDRPGHLRRDGHADHVRQHDPGRSAGRQLRRLRADPRRVPVRGDGRQLARRARAGRRRRRHHAVELPAAPDRHQDRSGAGRRQLRGAQAERGHPARRVHPGRDHRLGRAARRRVQPRHRHRPGRRRGHRQPPRRRHGVVHRLDPRRQARQRARRRDRQARAPRARRQVGQRHPRRRRPRRRRCPAA